MAMYPSPSLVNLANDAIFLDDHFDLLGGDFPQEECVGRSASNNLQAKEDKNSAKKASKQKTKEARLAQRMLKKKCREKQRRLVRSFALNCHQVPGINAGAKFVTFNAARLGYFLRASAPLDLIFRAIQCSMPPHTRDRPLRARRRRLAPLTLPFPFVLTTSLFGITCILRQFQDMNSRFDDLASLLDEVAPLPDDQKAGKNANRIELISRTIDVITKLRRERKRGAQEEEEEEGVARDSKRVKTDEHSAEGEEAAGAYAVAEAEAVPGAASNEVESCSRHPLMMVLPIVEPVGSGPSSSAVAETEACPTSSVMVYPVPYFNGGYDIPTPSELGGIFNIPVSAKPGVMKMKNLPTKPTVDTPLVSKDFDTKSLFNIPGMPLSMVKNTSDIAHCA